MTAADHGYGTAGCNPNTHCTSCQRDEPGDHYIACVKCGHRYPTARALRDTYRQAWNRTLLLAPTSPKAIRAWLRSRFRRTAAITYCPLCLHNL